MIQNSAHRSQSSWRDDRGAAAVEFALVLPVLLLVLFGIIEFGRYYNAQLAVTQAAREAVRAAVLGDDATAAANAAVGGLVITVDAPTACAGTPPTRSVTVHHDFDFIAWDRTNIDLNATAAMRCGG